MWLWLAPAVMLSQWGRQSRNSSVIASCDQGCITWGPITSCANNVLTDAGGLLLLLPANLWLIMLTKLEVNLPFKNAHPTPTEISRSTVRQGRRQRWLSLFLSLAAYEAPPSRPFGFQPGRQHTGQEWRSRVSSDASFPTHQVLPPYTKCCFLGDAGPKAVLHVLQSSAD